MSSTATVSHLTPEIETVEPQWVTPAHEEIPRSEWPFEWEAEYRKSFPLKFRSLRAMRLSAAMCWHPNIDGVDRAIFHFLAEYTNLTGYGAYPGNERLMAACGLGYSALHERLKKNINRGLIERTEQRGRKWASAYRICFESPYFPDCKEGAEISGLDRIPPPEKENVRSRPDTSLAEGDKNVRPTPENVRSEQENIRSRPEHNINSNMSLMNKKKVEESVHASRTLSSTSSIEEERSTASVPPPSGKDSASRAGNAARQRPKDPRLSTILKFFVRKYEKRTKVNAVVKDKDLAAVEEMLRDLPKVAACRICAWMNEAFDCGKFPFENGIVSLENFTKQYRRLDLSLADYDSLLDSKLRGKSYYHLTQEEYRECHDDLLILMPADSPKDGNILLNGREIAFVEVFGEERKFFRPSQ
jgi:hypothetical protein